VTADNGGTWDKGHGAGKNWEGEAPAEPKRQRMANGEQRMSE